MWTLALIAISFATPITPVLDLHCFLEPDQGKMHISATVQLAPESKPTTKASFFLADQMEVPKVAVVEPKELAGPVTPKQTAKNDHDVTYQIDLSKPLPAGQRLKLSFDYASDKPVGFVYMVGPKECLAGGYNTVWFPSVGDSRQMLGTMEFRGPSAFIVKASGKELDSKDENGQRTTRFQILRPTVPTFAAAPFKVTRVQGVVPMTLYQLKERSIAKEWTSGCAEILKVLTKQNGPYPFPDFAIVETPSPESSNEMGFSGASFEGFMFADSNAIDGGFNLAYYGHEIGHQWWGNYVGMKDDFASYMFGEGLAQYGSLQCVKTIGGTASAKQYRTFGYPDYSDRQCLFGSLFWGPEGMDRKLLDPPKTYSVFFHQLANSKGFLVWETLARTIGHDNFAKALQDITRKFGGTQATWKDLSAALQAHSKIDLTSFWEEFFRRTGAPCAWATLDSPGKVTLHQIEPTYHLRMPLHIRFKNGKTEVKEVAFDTAKAQVEIPASEVDGVELDPDFETYHTTPELSQMVEDYKAYAHAAFFMPLSNQMLQIGPKAKEALEHLPANDRFGVEFKLRALLSGVAMSTHNVAEAKLQAELALQCPHRAPENLPKLYLRLAMIARDAKDSAEMNRRLAQFAVAEHACPWPSGFLPQARQEFPDYRFDP